MVTAEPVAYDLAGPSDGALAYEHLRGADEAFAELYRRYYPRLVRLCARRTGDSHLAEDIAQETLVRALRYLSGFDTSRPMWPWLKTIATRIAYQSTQKTAGERCSDLDQEDPEAYAVDSPCHRIDDQLVLSAALDRVPARQRAALVMRYVDDWSTADSARFAGMTVPAFEQLLFRARRRLGTEYRRLTEVRRPGTLGVLPFAFVTLRRLRLALRTRVDTLAAGTGAAGTGLLGLATMGAAVTVMTAPAITAPVLNQQPATRILTTAHAAPQRHDEQLSLREAMQATSSGGTGAAKTGTPAAAPSSQLRAYDVGPARAATDLPEDPYGKGAHYSVSVTVLGQHVVTWERQRSNDPTVSCDDLDCEISVPGWNDAK